MPDVRPRVFTGFSPAGLRFLRELALHNERPWFNERKDVFERELQTPLHAFVDVTTEALARAKIPIGGDTKRSVFRIYRDVRFSNVKLPYKTHVSAYLSYDGARTTPGGLYVHIEPGASMMAIAFYHVDKPLLQRIRTEIAGNPKRFLTMQRALAKAGLHIEPPEAWDDSLVRMPRGFEAMATHELAPYLRLKSFVVRRTVTDAEAGSADLVPQAVRFAKAARPLLDFGWSLE